MTAHILICPDCGGYGITPSCTCGGTRVSPKPAKYSPEDRYGSYRRAAKKEARP
ncbi:ribosome biogenesis protein [Candidatus Woesearchaeota archaeon]|nr:ribosome biogenesis protein [Candidatus Woesearchaeota archaeon]